MRQGFVSIPLLSVLALIGLGIMLGWHTLSSARGTTLLLHGLDAREKVDNEAIAALAYMPQHREVIACPESDSAVGRITLTRKTCVRMNPVAPLGHVSSVLEGPVLGKRFPQFDYNSIFKRLQACQFPIQGSISLPTHPASPGAQVSASSCTTLMTSTREVYRENLKLNGSPEIAPSTKVVATLGFLEVTSSLTIGADSLVVAGGDLFIESLLSSGGSINVTLLSATGMVMVHFIDPRIRVRVIAWQGAFLPPHTSHHDSKTLPPFLEQQLLGLE